jgi:hypothetical protein
MVSAKGILRTEGFKRYCLDNGAWSAFVAKEPFDEAAFLKAYALAPGADFVVLPDIVAGGLRSLDFSLDWRDRLERVCLQLLAVQDGMETGDVRQFVGPDLGIFVGGTTEWKEATMAGWGKLGRECGAYMHVGRVNTIRRFNLCRAVGADSVDGSSASRYAVTLPKLENARQQLDFII